MTKHNDFCEQIGSRQDLLPQPEFIKVIEQLYWNPNDSRQKTGFNSRDRATNQPKPGTLNRLTWVLDQFQVTYDVNGMRKDDILILLPDEFAVWK
jgi:hypothetical protein